jgi:exodeoxyribonuclease III
MVASDPRAAGVFERHCARDILHDPLQRLDLLLAVVCTLDSVRGLARGALSWNGVAILARHHIPVLTCTSLPGNSEDHQARYIEAAIQGVLITSIYLPNGNPQPGPKFNYKLAWFERLIAHAAELMASGAPVVLAGDYNVVPTPHDIYPTRSLDNNALIQPESREAFARVLAQGWTDAMRKLDPDGLIWTFWDYKFERWQKDKGMRLDHFLLSPKLSFRLVDAVLTDGRVGRKTRATTRQHGSCLISRPESRFQPSVFFV